MIDYNAPQEQVRYMHPVGDVASFRARPSVSEVLNALTAAQLRGCPDDESFVQIENGAVIVNWVRP